MGFWNKKKSILLLAISILTANFIPQLFLGKAFLNWDPFLAFYSTFDFYKHQLQVGGSLLWSSGTLGGFPIYLDLAGGFFSPVNFILFKIFSVITAYNLALLFGITLLFASTYFFAKSLNISRASSLLVAVAFSFGYQITPWSNNLTVVNALFLLPFLSLALNKISKGNYLWIFWGALGVGYALISGQPQWVLMSFVGTGLYLLFLLFAGDQKRNLKSYSVLLLCFLVIIGVGVLIASPQLLASQRLSLLSAREGGLSFANAQVSAQKPYDWIWFLFPETQIKYINATEPSLYVGLLPLIFALLAAWFFRKDKRVTFFSFLFLFGLFTALKSSPILWFINKLPVFEYFRGSNRWMYLGNLGLAVLAGIGFDGLIDKKIPSEIWIRLERIFKKLVYLFVIVFGLANIVYWLFFNKILNIFNGLFDKYFYAKTSGLPLEHYHETLRAVFIQDFNNIGLANIKFIIPFGFFLIAYFVIRKIKSQNISSGFIVIIIILSALNLLLLHPNYYQTVPREISESEPEVARIIKSKEINNQEKFRILTVLPFSSIQKLRDDFKFEYTEEDLAILRHDILEVNSNASYGLDSIDGFSNLMPKRNAEIIGLIGSRRSTTGNTLEWRDISLADKLKELSSRISLLSALNIKYLITPEKLPSLSDLNFVQEFNSTRFNIPFYLYENKKNIPRAYLANSVIFLKEGDDLNSFNKVIDTKTNLHETTIIECNACQSYKNYFSKSDKLDILEYKDGFIKINAQISAGRWLVLSESNIPGWQIEIDEEPVRQYYSNYIFQGVYLPAGKHRISLQYKGI